MIRSLNHLENLGSFQTCPRKFRNFLTMLLLNRIPVETQTCLKAGFGSISSHSRNREKSTLKATQDKTPILKFSA